MRTWQEWLVDVVWCGPLVDVVWCGPVTSTGGVVKIVGPPVGSVPSLPPLWKPTVHVACSKLACVILT